MIITKIFDIVLNIDNINIIFNKDINLTILELIKTKYENKCYLGVFITNINRILNRSLIESDQSDLNGIFHVSIQFEAECIIYNTNEVILEMTVQDNINNSLSISNEICSAVIKVNKNISNFTKGQKIPIIVGKAKFDTGSNKIRINSYPFIPIIDNKNVYYKISKLKENDKNKLNEKIINYINNEELIKKEILNIKNNKWDYFNKLVFPYKNDLTNTIIKKNNMVDLLELDNLENKIILQHNEIDMSKRMLCTFDNYDTNVNAYLEYDNFEMLYPILKKYYLYIKLINELSKIYDTDEKIKLSHNVFDLYIKYKK
jgi:hypothetical protein